MQIKMEYARKKSKGGGYMEECMTVDWRSRLLISALQRITTTSGLGMYCPVHIVLC